MESAKQGRWAVISLVFFSLAIVGIYHTVVGTLVPAIRQEFHLEATQVGLLALFSWLGFATAVLGVGFLSDHLSKFRILASALAVVGIFSLLFAAARRFESACVWFFLVGTGLGSITSTSSAFMVTSFPRKGGFMMSVHHAFYAVGTISGPQIARLMLGIRDWRQSYYAIGLVALLLAIPLFFLKDPSDRPMVRDETKPPQRLHKNTILLLLIVLAVLGSGTQNGLFFWLVTYLSEARDLSLATASVGLSLFSLGLAAGRLASGWLTLRMRTADVLTVLFAIVVSVLICIVLSGSVQVLLFLCALAGLGCSGLFPLLLTLAGLSQPNLPGAAIGLVSTAAGIGSSVIPELMSLAAELISPTGIVLTGTVTSLIGLLVTLRYRRRLISLQPHLST